MNIREEIKNLINDAIDKIEFKLYSKPDVRVVVPPSSNYGDYSVIIGYIKEVGELMGATRVPKEYLIEINKFIQNSDFYKNNIIKTIIVEPVYLNFYLKPEFLQQQVKEIIKQGKKFGKVDIGKKQKVQVEFISSNPTGPLTVANGRGGPMGDVLANVLNAAGYKTEKEFYVNDSGNQIEILGHSILKDSQAQYKGKYIDELAKKISAQGGPASGGKDSYEIGQEAAKIIIEEMIKKTTDKLGIKYDKWFFESNLRKKNLPDKIVKFLKEKDLLYEKEDAVWLKSTNFGDTRDRVLIKKDKNKTYLANDIAYHYNKFKERKFDKVINIWGADHHGDVPGLMAGVEAIGYKGKLEIILHQFITVLEKGKKVKMSKRLGTFIPMDELLDAVGADVVRFFFLMHSADRHMDFNLDLAKEKSEKNPVYYVQYAYARINSIFRKSKGHNLSIKLNLLNHPSEKDLIKSLIKLPEIIEDTARDYQVQRLPSYAIELATAFHKFYTECRVLGENKDLEKARLALIMATKIVLENILDLMGISKPQKM